MAGTPRVAAKMSTITVAVVGLTASAHQAMNGEGAGKSCLCNRFVWPHADHYYTNHPYIVNYSEFGSSVINNSHFLYWGETTCSLEDGSNVLFRVVEHTEFVEDNSLKAFSFQKPYHKRVAGLKMNSGGKVAYVNPNQLTLPEEYANVGRLPDRGIVVEGFILCIDLSAPFGPNDLQREFFNKLISSVQGSKKPVVIACTKMDMALPDNLSLVKEAVDKLKKVPPMIEVSAHEDVNIDLCFLVLAHLIDSKKPRTRVIPYDEAKLVVDARVRKNESSFQAVLDWKLVDFTMETEAALELVKKEVEWQSVAQLKGTERCKKLVKMKMSELWLKAVEKQKKMFFEILPGSISTLLQDVTLSDTADSCLARIMNHDQFLEHFVDVDRWEENKEFLFKFSVQIPVSILKGEGGMKCIHEHMQQLQSVIKEERAKVKIKSVLENTSALLPGVPVQVAMDQLGLAEDAKLISDKLLQSMFQDRMTVIEQSCIDDVHELLLERADLFVNHFPDPKDISTAVQDDSRFKRLDLAPTQRTGAIVKHISHMEVLNRGPYYTPDLVTSLEKHVPGLQSLQDCRHGYWTLEADSPTFNIAIVSMEQESGVILRSDIKNQCSGADMYDVEGRQVHLRIGCFHSDVTSLVTERFVPQGLVMLCSNEQEIDWLEKLAEDFLIPSSSSVFTSQHYRGIPTVLVVLDNEYMEGTSNSSLYNKAKKLTSRLQCVLVAARPVELPGRLTSSETTNSFLFSLFDSTQHRHLFYNSTLSVEPDGLNIGIFALPGDPYSSDKIAASIACQQLVAFNSRTRTVFVKTALERQHKLVSLPIYSTLNAVDFRSHPSLGFVIFYSADRKASLASVQWLVPRLHAVPVLLVAITQNNTSQLVKEGEQLSKQLKKAEFVQVSEENFDISSLVDFYLTCFFTRFSSWKAQPLSEDAHTKIFKRKPKVLPNRPLPDAPSQFSLSLSETTMRSSSSRYSLGSVLDDHALLTPSSTASSSSGHLRTPSAEFGTLPRSPSRALYQPQVPEEDDPTYSSPADIGLTSPTRNSHKRQLRAGSDKRRSAVVLNSTPTPPPSLPTSGDEYAVIPSANAIGKLDTLKRSQQNSFESKPPSVPAPPPPFSPPEVEPDIYASVQTPPRERAKIARGYDRLEPSPDHSPPPPLPAPPRPPKADPNGYDHLTPRSRRRMEEKGLLPVEQMSPDEDEEDLYDIPDKKYPGGRGKPLVGPKPQVTPKPGYMPKPSARSGPQHIAAPTDPDALYALPDKVAPPKKLPLRSIAHAAPEGSPDSLYAIPDRVAGVRTPSPTGDLSPDNDDDDEPPPLPARNYSWSDIEDDDDDDEEDDTLSELGPLAEYATVAEAMVATAAHKAAPERVKSVTEEMEAVYSNLKKLRLQMGITESSSESESIYDTLEKVVEQQRQEVAKPSLKSPTIPLSKNALKLMKKMEKKAQQEANRRKKQEAKQRKREEEEKKRIERARKKGKKIKVKETTPVRSRYFGSHLRTIVDEDCIPTFVKVCARIVESHGLNVEGIYRVSGKKDDVMDLQDKYDNDPNLDLEALDLCVNAICSALKAFFKLLPDPLIPVEMLPRLSEIPELSFDAQKVRLHDLFSELPKENLCTLHFLVDHLNIIQQYQDVNKMNASNLAIVFWPTLMRPALRDLADPSKHIAWQLALAKVIENPDLVPTLDFP